MPLHIPSGHWHAKLIWHLNGDNEPIVSTVGLRQKDIGEERLANDIAGAVAEAWAGAWPQNHMASTYTFWGVEVTDGEDATAFAFSGAVGSNSSSALPQNCSMLVRKTTARRGRAHTGRMFLPAGFLFEAQVSDLGEISPGELPERQAYLDQFVTNLGDSTPVITHPKADLEPVVLHNDPAVEPTLITRLLLQGRIATQRQRLRR